MPEQGIVASRQGLRVAKISPVCSASEGLFRREEEVLLSAPSPFLSSLMLCVLAWLSISKSSPLRRSRPLSRGSTQAFADCKSDEWVDLTGATAAQCVLPCRPVQMAIGKKAPMIRLRSPGNQNRRYAGNDGVSSASGNELEVACIPDCAMFCHMRSS